MFRCPVNLRFGLPLIVRTPSLVSNAQFVSVLVAFASRVRLCVVRSPDPTMLPSITTCPPRGHCLVTVKVVLIGNGAIAADAVAEDPLCSTPRAKDAAAPEPHGASGAP